MSRCPQCGSKECCGGDMAEQMETLEMRMKATEADALSMALRLLGEDESTFSPDVAEVMDRWRPLALAALDYVAKNGGKRAQLAPPLHAHCRGCLHPRCNCLDYCEARDPH